jgi:hypothetical protein
VQWRTFSLKDVRFLLPFVLLRNANAITFPPQGDLQQLVEPLNLEVLGSVWWRRLA